jgi:hypothetical protein
VGALASSRQDNGTVIGVRARAGARHGHRLATAAGGHGRGRVSAEGLSALGEVLGSAVNLCSALAQSMPAAATAVAAAVVAAAQGATTTNNNKTVRRVQPTIELRDEGIGLVAVHRGAGAWVHVTQCPLEGVEVVSGT